MKNVLAVEDSLFFGQILKNRLENETDYKIFLTRSLKETKDILDKLNNNFFAGILDFELPDALDGEIINEVTSRGIPSIVFTGIINSTVRDIVWSKSVVDYVLKEDPGSIEYIISLLKRIEKNPNIKIVVVDPSQSSRQEIVNLLKIHKYSVLEAENGIEVIELLKEHPDTKLIITEFNISKMDGLTLVHKIREKYRKDELAIIGISAEEKSIISARFLKYGANDFIAKQSFMTEEFYRRVSQNIESLEQINTIREASIKDFLTGLYNRRYFFEFGQKLIANASRNNITLVCAMIDIDNFKSINDIYGHKSGDIVLTSLASILKARVRLSDTVARIGGEEFCLLAVNMDGEFVEKIFEELCAKIANTPIYINENKTIKITVSIGVFTKHKESLDEMLKEADLLLYKAKELGKNRVIVHNKQQGYS